MMSDEFLIHPEHLSARPQVVQGTLLPGELERLEGTLANGEGELRFRIAAVLDPHRRKVVSCMIEGFVFLTCQSTLEVFRHEVAVQDRLILVDRDSELPGIEQESDEEDYLVADGPLDIRDLVEDAILLALPMVPRKPGLEAAKAEDERPAAVKQSPFAALASLERKSDK